MQQDTEDRSLTVAVVLSLRNLEMSTGCAKQVGSSAIRELSGEAPAGDRNGVLSSHR